jgi:hypothetical protein
VAAAAAAGDSSSSSSSSGSDTLYLPAPPPQLQKLQRRLLQAGIGSSRWRSSSSSSDQLYIVEQQPPESQLGSGVMLRRANAAQVEEDRRQHQLHRAEEVLVQTGFSQIFEIIRDSCKPAVGHNVRFDLAFSLAAFVQSPLPRTWSGYRKLVGQWFPGGVYDTKYLAHCLPSSSGGDTDSSSSGSAAARVLVDTALGSLYELFAQVRRADRLLLYRSLLRTTVYASCVVPLPGAQHLQLSRYISCYLALRAEPQPQQHLSAVYASCTTAPCHVHSTCHHSAGHVITLVTC